MIKTVRYSSGWVIFLGLMVQVTAYAAELKNKTTDHEHSLHRLACFNCLFKAGGDTIPEFFVSNTGSDSNSGKSPELAKLHIDNTEASFNSSALSNNGSSLLLAAGSVFREQLDPGYHNIKVSTYNRTDGNRLAKITGMDVIKSWNPAPGTTAVYQHSLTHTIDFFSPEYTYIMVAEIDTMLEKTAPLIAVKYLTLVSSLEKCNASAGTYFNPPITVNPLNVYMHATQGIPGNNKYRYEVTTRNFSINGYYVNNAVYENLFLQSSAYGYGMLAAGDYTQVKNVIFQGGGTHHTVIKSGTIDSCFFLPGPRGLKDRIAAVFYEGEGTGNVNKISNTVFIDVPYALYTHTNGLLNHKSLTIDKVFLFSDTTDALIGLGAADTDSISISNSYIEGYRTGWYGGPARLLVNNVVFRNITQSGLEISQPKNVTGNITISNTLIKTNGNDNNQAVANNWFAYGIRSPYPNTQMDVSNLIFHGFSTWHQPGQTVVVYQTAGQLKAHHNIYICDVNDTNNMQVYYADNSTGTGTATNVSSDYNVYVLLRGTGFYWTVKPNNEGDPNIFSFFNWQRFTGQDKHSVFIDLRNKPLGLKTIFTDPENGNYTLTGSPEAGLIKSMAAGMITPPLYYPIRPTYKTIDKMALPGGLTFTATLDSTRNAVITWKAYNESQFAYFNVEYSTNGTSFNEIGSRTAKADGKDNDYAFVHTSSSPDTRYYRLQVVNNDSSHTFSSVIALKPKEVVVQPQTLGFTVYPNPVLNAVSVTHPARKSAWIDLYDFSGRPVKQWPVVPNALKSVVSLDGIPPGLFLLQWTSGKEKRTAKVLKDY